MCTQFYIKVGSREFKLNLGMLTVSMMTLETHVVFQYMIFYGQCLHPPEIKDLSLSHTH